MLWLIIWTLCLIVISTYILIQHNLTIRKRIKQFLFEKFGLAQMDEFRLSYHRHGQRPPLIIHIKGIRICIINKNNSTPIRTNSRQQHLLVRMISALLSRRVPKAMIELLLDIPMHLLRSGLANFVALHIDNLVIEKDNISFKVDHIYIDSKLIKGPGPKTTTTTSTTRLFQEKVFAIGVQIGPIQLVKKVADGGSLGIFEMTTACLATISCHFKTRRLSFNDVDLDIQLGKMNVDVNECMTLFTSSSTAKTSDSNTVTLEEILNSIRVTIQCISFTLSKPVITTIEIHNITSVLGRNNAPIVQLNTELIQCVMMIVPLLTIPSMEIKVSQSDRDNSNSAHAVVPPHTEFISVTWILNAPIVNIPLNNAALMNVLLKSSRSSKQEQQYQPALPFEKVIPDLPMCTFALVLNSPKLELPQVDAQCRCGYITTESLIIRFSGEYLVKERSSNSNSMISVDDVPSSSSSSGSSSNLDALFAQEEYQWLRKSGTFQQQRPTLTTTTTTKQWLNLMGRVSRRSQNTVATTNTSRRRWAYRVSAKIIVQRFNLGYIMESTITQKEFVRVKNAVLIFKIRMNVVLNTSMRYETMFSLENGIQSEVAIDKPVIYLWNDQDVISSIVFWINSVPQCVRNNKVTPPREEQSALVQMLIRNVNFSLDVIEGSIVAVSLDRSHQDEGISPPTPPPGYIVNTPKESVFTRLDFQTQKFTFVCEGPGNSSSEWKVRCQMEKLYIQQSSNTIGSAINDNVLTEEEKEDEEKKMHVILWISQLNLAAKLTILEGLSKHVSISTKIKKYGICYSIRNHYACLLFIKSLLTMKYQLGSKIVESKKVEKSTAPTPLLIDLDVHVARGDIHVYLPKDTQLYLRMDDFSLLNESAAAPLVKWRNFMALGVSALHPESWEQIVEIDKAQILVKNGSVKLKARKIFLTIPYKYVLANVIDNLIGLVKAIKDLHSRILSKNAFTFFGPTINNDPVLIPCIHLRAKVFTIHFDDDPFEAKLRNILRTGLLEQQKRLAYREALDDKIQEMLSATAVGASSASTTAASKIAASDSISSSSTRQPQEPAISTNMYITEDNATFVASPSPDLEVHSQIMEANKNLLEYYSEFWIKNINLTKNKEKTFYQELHIRENYRNSATCDELDESLDEIHIQESSTFIIDILSRPLHPPLANFSAQFAKVSFKPADFSLSETRQFINTIGGGVPLDNDFSIIIPFHLSIKAGKTWIKMRDYPLPLLYVPPPTMVDDNVSSTTRGSRNNSRVSWTLEGNYAVGDEVGNSGGSRIIPVPVIPAGSSSLGYCLSAVRTASPLKFYSVIDYHILTKSMSTICWSISYNPAIQDIIIVLETLTPSQVDPSPRIGFWDKVRFMIHTQTKFSFIGGGDLAIVVKGTRDPYLLQGRGAGLAKVWSDNVVWLLGYKNPQNEFMQFLSKSYAFGVPDLVRGGYVPNFPDSLESLKKRTEGEEKEHSKFLKIVLKLSNGIHMGIGLHYERLACEIENGVCFKCASAHHLDRCRTQVFSPHYNVIFQSVKQVETFYDKKNYDAFKGFRSDFIHLSLSIVKHQNGDLIDSPDFSKDDPYFINNGIVSQNAMYLSPCFIEHFGHWFRLFGSPVSLPIREGNLFPRDEPKSPSFGEHLNTIKYKIVINPLAIGFFCTDEETYLNVKGGGSAGLKARVNAFSVDLHSRREVIRPPPTAPVDEVVKTEINYHELEIELHDIDLRVIKATQLSSKNGAAKSSSTSPSSYSDAASFDDDDTKYYSFQWVDPKDYVILDSVPQLQQNNSSRRKIEVHPFAFSPLFYYVKQEDEAGTEKREYLRGTHDCIMGKGMDSHEFQKAHLNRRASDLDKIIENYDKQLDIVLNAINNLHHHDKQTLKEQYKLLMEKLDYLRTNRHMLYTYIAQLILETELNMSEIDNRGGSPHTTTSSIGRRDELSRWEMLMGHFKDRFFIHNPQIIWNNSVRDAVYYWQDIKNNRSVQDYNLSARCLKFLEDLVHTAEKQQQWKPDVPSTANNSDIFTDDRRNEKNVTQELIDKLLSERSHNFVAYNEKEEEKGRNQQQQHSQDYDGIHVFENNSENVNDPDYQYKNIPDSYEMKSKYLIDMINPQVNFQSEKGLDHLILFTNERIHVKAFGIIDNSSTCAADKEVRLAKDRIIVSLDNAQLLVAKRMEFLSFDLLTQSCYGQCRNLHWAAWVHPEQLWYYKSMKFFDNFQRIASQLCGTIQLDRYNHLRIKINKYNTSRKSPFEDRTNTIQLHFPQFKLTLNSQQGHILYYTLINLLLGNDGSPRKKERASRFKDFMLAAERSDLAETVKQVGFLQNRSRSLLNMHKRFMNELSYLDPFGIREFNRNRKKMRENLEKLYLVVEAIRSIQTFRRDIHLEETDNAMRFSFTSDEIVWEAVMDDANQSPICRWTLNNIKYVFLDKPNGSSKNTIEVDKMQIKNTTDSPVFTNVLDAYIEPGQVEDPDFSRQKMLRGVLESLPPVGGIPVIQQLEINLVPLHLQISTAFGTAMKDYFFPRVIGDYVNNTEASSSNDGEASDEQDDDDEEYEEEEVPAVDGLKVASRTSIRSDILSVGGLVDKSNSSTLFKREESFASFDLITQKVKQTVTRKRKAKSDELTIMKKRSSTNRTFIYVRIPATKHCLSLQGPTQKTFYNLYNFPFKQPKLEYRNKTWSMAEMMEEIQKQFLRAILRHSPALLKNKLMTNSRQQITAMSTSPTTYCAPTSQTSRSVAPSLKSTTLSNVDLMDDSVIFSRNDHKSEADTIKSSYQTETEEEGSYEDDVKSLYSNDPEEELQRLAELQTVEKRISVNVDKELLDVYMKKYKIEEEMEEIVRKGRILFGDSYNGLYKSAEL